MFINFESHAEEVENPQLSTLLSFSVLMKKLIETIINDPEIIEFTLNSTVNKLVGTLNFFTEEEFNNFIEEISLEYAEDQKEKRERLERLIEYVCKERLNFNTKFMNNLSIKTNKTTPTLLNEPNSSYTNSPEKQNSSNGGTRWIVPREERRKILDLMERHREDQKRRKKEDWCRLSRDGGEFDEIWENELERTELNENDLLRMRIDEGIDISLKDEIIKRPDSKRVKYNQAAFDSKEFKGQDYREHSDQIHNQRPLHYTHPSQNNQYTQYPQNDRHVRPQHSQQYNPPSNFHPFNESHRSDHNSNLDNSYHHSHTHVSDVQIVDFDCIEHLLISLSKSASLSSSANFILNCSDQLYKSDLMFYSDLKEFDQPFFLYYGSEDDLSPLKHYEFYKDDLGKYVRNLPYKDTSLKFYQERAFRYRYISRKPYELFFNEFEFKRLRVELENLDENCDEFHFWFVNAILKKGTVFITKGPLLRSFALLLVLSRLVPRSTFDISNSIWSQSKFGPEWTLKEISKHSKGNIIGFITRDKSSKLSLVASRMGLKFL